MTDPASLTLSVLALSISAVTAWLTLFRRGTVRMTQPTVIFFGPDSPRSRDPLPKVFLRTLLFSTSKRGRVIESMHVALARNEMLQNFNIWVYGDERLVRGSGLFVGETGVAANHHFLVPNDGSSFRFTVGHYRMDDVAKLLGDDHPIVLFSQTLEISREIGTMLEQPYTGLFFDWGPDSAVTCPTLTSASRAIQSSFSGVRDTRDPTPALRSPPNRRLWLTIPCRSQESLAQGRSRTVRSESLLASERLQHRA